VAMWTSAILLAGCAEATWAQTTALTVSGSPVPLYATTRSVELNIAKDKGTTLSITNVFSATVAAGVVPSQTRTATFTMSSNQ
jgi:hypothetical protein